MDGLQKIKRRTQRRNNRTEEIVADLGIRYGWNSSGMELYLESQGCSRRIFTPLGKSGRAGGAIGTYLKRQKIWQTLKAEAKQEREVLTPYSFRHRFAYYGHNRPQEDGIYRAPKKIAEAMAHEYETHLLSYARFDSKDLAKSFDQIPLS